MSVSSFSLDLEPGLASELSPEGTIWDPDNVMIDSGSMRRQLGHRNTKRIGILLADPGPGFGSDISGETWDFCPRQSGQYIDEAFKSWQSNAESMLLFACLFSATIFPFVIEGYNKLSPDRADQAAALFNQVAQQLGGTSGGTALALPPPLRLDAVWFKQNLAVFRTTTLWLSSLGLNMICVLWVLWQQLWQQSIDFSGQGDGLHTLARLRVCFPFRIGRFGMGHGVKVIWMLLHASVSIFFVGLVDFMLPINKTITRILLGYLTLAFLCAATTLNPRHLSSSRSSAPFSNWT